MQLDGRTLVVTGASSGLGRATAITLAEYGAKVVNADVRRADGGGGDPTDEVIADADGDALFVETDVTDLAAVRAAVETAEAEFGSFGGIVNNAGRGTSDALTETDEENWRGTIELNLTGVYHGSLAAVEAMLDGDGETVVNIGSIVGVTGLPNAAPYSASKGGVIALTRQIARDYADRGIRANCVSLGFIDTPMLREDTHDGTTGYAVRQTPMDRVGEPGEAADAVAFLSSDASSYITGENIMADSGYAMS